MTVRLYSAASSRVRSVGAERDTMTGMPAHMAFSAMGRGIRPVVYTLVPAKSTRSFKARPTVFQRPGFGPGPLSCKGPHSHGTALRCGHCRFCETAPRHPEGAVTERVCDQDRCVNPGGGPWCGPFPDFQIRPVKRRTDA